MNHGTLQGDLSYYVHGSKVWICLTFSDPLSKFRSSSTIFLWNIEQTHVLGTLQALLVSRSTLIHSPRTRQNYPLLGCVEVGVDCEFPKSVLLDRGNGKFSTIRIEYP